MTPEDSNKGVAEDAGLSAGQRAPTRAQFHRGMLWLIVGHLATGVTGA